MLNVAAQLLKYIKRKTAHRTATVFSSGFPQATVSEWLQMWQTDTINTEDKWARGDPV